MDDNKKQFQLSNYDYAFRVIENGNIKYFDFDDIKYGIVDVTGGGVNDVTVEMNTLLLDSHGKYIFSGDIVKFRVWDHFWIEGEAQVYYDEGCFRLNRNHALIDYMKDGGTVTVIGNIHEIGDEA